MANTLIHYQQYAVCDSDYISLSKWNLPRQAELKLFLPEADYVCNCSFHFLSTAVIVFLLRQKRIYDFITFHCFLFLESFLCNMRPTSSPLSAAIDKIYKTLRNLLSKWRSPICYSELQKSYASHIRSAISRPSILRTHASVGGSKESHKRFIINASPNLDQLIRYRTSYSLFGSI